MRRDVIEVGEYDSAKPNVALTLPTTASLRLPYHTLTACMLFERNLLIDSTETKSEARTLFQIFSDNTDAHIKS